MVPPVSGGVTIKAELLASRLKQWNLLEKNVQISSFRSPHQQLGPFFTKEGDLVFCYVVDGLMNVRGIKMARKNGDYL